MYLSPRFCASLVGDVEELHRLAGQVHLARRAFDLRQPRDGSG
jgi:hypothetical protein